MQGVLDFSMLLNERIFSNREIEYKFTAVDCIYDDRKELERAIKQQLMPYGKQELFDTHDNGYYWLGKCQSVEVEDDEEYKRLNVTITFDCYPFMYSHASYFDDVWDTFNFDRDVAGFTKYVVSGSKSITLINTSVNSIIPEITTTATLTVTINGESYIFNSGSSSALSLSLSSGVNTITITGTGTIAFHWNSEVMG